MYCRRTYLATLGMLLLAGLGAYHQFDVSMAIAGIVGAVAGANAWEKRGEGNTDEFSRSGK